MAGGTGFVNQGPDHRIGGPIGKALAWLQRTGAFKTPLEPRSAVLRVAGSELMLALNRRYPAPWVSLFIKTGPRYASFRGGWRYDKNWGDANVQGYNPDPHIIGGAFPEVILKFRLTQIVHY